METRFMLVAGSDQVRVNALRDELGEGWEIIAADNGETAIERFHQYAIDMVLLGDDLNDTAKRMLKKIFPFQQPEIRFVEEGIKTATQLAEEIRLEQTRMSRERNAYHFMDNAFGYPICLQ